MEKKIKSKLYDVLSPLIPDLRDNPPKEVKKSYVLYRISNGFSTPYKLDCEQDTTYLTFDIFSVYDGEKEVLDIKDIIKKNIKCLYELGEVSYVTMSAFNIINEENPVKKHGILTFRILSTLN